MRNSILISIILPVLVCMSFFSGMAQTSDYADTKEKVYVQTSHVYFRPGETMFFKIYVVKAKDQTPSRQSNVVYVDIINPAGNVLRKLNYPVENGYAEGSFDFDEGASGGVYKIRSYTTWMRNENDSTFFVKEITLLKVIAPRLLMKLEFPEKGYGAGDEVKAAFSIRNLSDQPIRNYSAKFTVSIGGEVVQTNTFKTDNEGKSQVRFVLPSTLKTSDGLLNITVHYDSYTEAISRSIPIVLNKIDLQFMPEGGTFINGISTNMAFKALNENGKPADIKGEVWDNRGNKITAFESYHFGMGKFSITPQKGLSYKVKITSPANIPQQFDLPAAIDDGIVMNISKNNHLVNVRLNSTDKMAIRLVAQTKNTTYYEQKMWLQKGENNIEVDETKFPVGIARFTLYTTDNMPLAERLVFLNESRNLQVSISTNKPKYLPREKVVLTIKTLDEKGQPVPSNLSLAVVDDKLWTLADDKQDHILSWLLMSSELKGKIEEPVFYFKKDEPKAIPSLDLVMLTHGYRYFDYTETVQQEGKLPYIPDQPNIVSGTIVNGDGQPVKATVYLVYAGPGGKAIQYNTAGDGVFFFSQLLPNSNYYLFAQADHKKEKVVINVQQVGIGYNPLRKAEKERLVFGENKQVAAKPIGAPMPAKKKENADAFKEPAVNQEDDMPFKDAHANLENVVVVGFGAQAKRVATGSVTVIRGADIGPASPVAALQGKVAGLQVTKEANPLADPNVVIRFHSAGNVRPPLCVVDGVPVEEYRLHALNPDDIESITVLKDATATTLYGSRAAYGVLVIETKKFKYGSVQFDFSREYYYASKAVRTSNGPVFSYVRRFYAPAYTSMEPETRTDFRETIYWNPVVQTDKNGMAVVEYFNSDASTTFRAIAEGIGYNGKLGRTENTYVVQNAMSVDAKIPPYLTVGDKAKIPLVIKNNTSTDLGLVIKVNLPDHIKTGNFSGNIVLPADSSTQILISVEATATMKGTIQFSVESPYNTERVILPITAADKGFPVIETFSGNKSTSHEFIINKAIAGSLHANLKLFKNLEGQLLDGIESMLREPYGCFEQTSSSTYPNIFVLKYLRESGKSNPQIEQRALKYIRDGYQRLIGFETPVNGFEWFGHTPPHEALTAYGLLEFTDMQEFVDVDKRMLARTKEFLLGRRDGKGSFKLASGGYDRFAAVPDKIANIYIVYALTQAGIGKEIQLEYNTAVKKALESNDAYQMAMMALAASNMKNVKDYDMLMNALNTRYQKMNLSAETSVVNSRDASLRVETMSLYALALMRQPSPQAGQIATIISKILAEKTYYGYGATQATVLALQAIVEYSKLTGRVTESSQITFTMNNATAVESTGITGLLHEGKNVFGIKYGREEKNIPYSLEVAYNTLTPPNSEKAELQLTTRLANNKTRVGETVRMEIEVTNTKSILQPMAVAKIGIPAGLAAQPWQLKEITEKNQVAYYEIFDNYLVLYWMGFAPGETKKINLDLKAEIVGAYKGKASNTYLYYTPEYKNWNEGVEVEIGE